MNVLITQYGKWIMLVGALILFLKGWQKFYTLDESSTPYLIGSIVCVLGAIIWMSLEPDQKT
ncbi:MAG: hypothetical protein KTR30_22405 [Saprospiraceae bacterium]|nr:hypothetical protein [Saprospiraceae bacterium]